MAGERGKARFERTSPDRLSTSLAQAVEHVQELVCVKPQAAALSGLMAKYGQKHGRADTRVKMGLAAVPGFQLFAGYHRNLPI
jgi:hypothetical protein